MESLENIEYDKKLKITVYKDTKNVCREEAKKINIEIDKSACNLIAELLWKKVRVIAEDLEMFAKHAKRSTINAEDVKLLVRHNEKLKEDITKMSEGTKKRKNSKKSEAPDSDFTDDVF